MKTHSREKAADEVMHKKISAQAKRLGAIFFGILSVHRTTFSFLLAES